VKIESIDVEAAINNARELINSELDLSPALRSSMEVLLLVITLLFNRTILNSKNSSKPPASDLNRLKSSRAKSRKPSGAQLGHVGKTSQQIDDPDEVEVLSIDRRALPKGDYHSMRVETRQVSDIDISRVATEYQTEVLENTQGQRFVAQFLEGVTKAVQYGTQIKAHAVYLLQNQL
jgi:transposase